MGTFRAEYESVAVSSRIRLARNLRGYPFPGRLVRDAHAVEQASEIIRNIAGELTSMEEFTLYEMDSVSPETAGYLTEHHLISRDLMRMRTVSAALISKDESISVMINEEDHVREQYFMRGFDLRRAYERISGIDEIISDSVPFAYDPVLGYLTACPTNLGTGLRASVMLFLPAVARRGLLRRIMPTLNRLGLTVRGVYGEGSDAQGDLFQVSNEVTLGVTEEEILFGVEQAVGVLVKAELLERSRMMAEEGLALKDRIFRSLGVLSSCVLLDDKEFARRISDLKLGVALGFFGEEEEGEDRMRELEELYVRLCPGGIRRMRGKDAEGDEDAFRAEYVTRAIGGLHLVRS